MGQMHSMDKVFPRRYCMPIWNTLRK